MSIVAMNWAMQQRTGSPSAQCVLYVLADVASPAGICWQSARYIAERTAQSVDTVRRRLKDLEENGILVRFERHDESGRRTTDEIRLKMGEAAVDQNDESAPDCAEKAAGGTGQIAQGGTAQIAQTDSAPVHRGTGQSCPDMNRNTNQDSNPQSPLQGAVGSDDLDMEKSLETLKRVYPAQTTKPGLLSQLFAALNQAEREKCISGGHGYAVFCHKHKRRPLDPIKFVRDPDLWDEFAKLAPKPEAHRVFVERHSRAWAAWNVHRAITLGQNHYLPHVVPGPDGKQGAMCAAEWPPGGEALADFASETGRPNFDQWVVLAEGEKNWWAWTERVRKWTGGGELVKDVFAGPGPDETRVINGKTYNIQDRISGAMLPCEWPPKVPKADPPENTRSEHAATAAE